MKLRRFADCSERDGADHCRVRAVKLPLFDARYEVSGEVGGNAFSCEGSLAQAENALLKSKAPRPLYDMLVEACIKVGEMDRLQPDLSAAQMKCMASLALWRQSIECVGVITGLGTEGARETMHTLYAEGYIAMVERNDGIRFEFTPKGDTAMMFLSDRKGFKAIRQDMIRAASAIDWSAWKNERPEARS